jgi:hypothetical protein
MAEQQPGLILTLSNGVQHALRFGTRSDAEAAIDDFISGGARLGREWIRADGQTAVARAHIISVAVVEDIEAHVAAEALSSTP